MSFKFTTVQQGNDIHLTLTGFLDDSALPVFAAEIPGKLVINLQGVTMINSLGCRSWLKWIASVHARDGVVLKLCSSAFISQVNVLKGFVPEHVQIESFQVPYLCRQCAHEDHVVFTADQDGDAPETRACPNCGGVADIDVVEWKYFSFLGKKPA
jgi:hypothetical protein